MYWNNCVQVRDDGRLLVNLFSFVKQIFRVNPRLVIAMFTFSYVWFSKVSVVFHWPQWILFVYFLGWGRRRGNNWSEQVFVQHIVSPSILTSNFCPSMSPSLSHLAFSPTAPPTLPDLGISLYLVLCLHSQAEHSWLRISLVSKYKPIHVSWTSNLPWDLLN